MRGIMIIPNTFFSFLSVSLGILASEQAQQPFEFGEMSAPSYTLPPLPYAYNVSSPINAPAILTLWD